MLSALAESKWNFTTAAHLLNRAGFGGTPAQIEKVAALGLRKAVDQIVNYETIPDDAPNPEWARPDPSRLEKYREKKKASPQEKQQLRKEEQRAQREKIQELRYWWLQRMAHSPRPLQEKLVLFWHGHFATSAQKVKNAYFMWRQNDIFRRYASGSWLTLLTEVSKDPAMLIWLDQAQSRKEHPNENFAREVMELFALGEGNYTEQDVSEAARSFTGWTLDRLNGEFSNRPNAHDAGEKTIFGATGKFDGDAVLKLIVQHPHAAPFIARKLWTFFAAEDPSDDLVAALAATFRKGGNHFKPLLQAMFLSEEFYAPEVIRQQVKGPVQWLVSSVRMLERELPPAAVSANALRQLGQDLLMPPNVKGWDGGLSWINTNNLINRYNYAAFLVLGENPLNPPKTKGGKARRLPPGTRVDIARLVPEPLRRNKSKLIAALQKRFLQGELRPEHQSSLRAYLDAQAEIDDVDLLHAIRLVLCTPEFQLC
jgi:uncharacterized protein (DUF1800 family)